MRSAPRPTARGWGALAFALVAALLAAPMRSDALGRAAALAAALVVVSYGWTLAVQRTARNPVVRTVTPSPMTVGSPARIDIRSPRRLPWDGARDLTPDSLDVRAPSRHGRGLTYSVTPRRRGAARIGPILVSRADPLGLVSFTARVGPVDAVVVWPATEPVPVAGSARSRHAVARVGGIPRPSPDDVILRAYRPGDDPRRIHWRSSARSGDVLVRADTPSSSSVADIVVDVGHHLVEADHEWAISAAASGLVALVGRSERVRLHTVGPSSTITAAPGAPGPALTHLATFDSAASVAGPLAGTLAGTARELSTHPSTGRVVAVLTHVPPAALPALVRLGGERPCHAILVPATRHAHEIASRLRAASWTVAVGGAGVPLTRAYAPDGADPAA